MLLATDVWAPACSDAANRRYKHPGICLQRPQSRVWEPSGCQRAESRVRRGVSAPIKRCRPAFPMTGDSPSLWAASPAPPWLPSVSSRSPPDPAGSGCEMIMQCANQLIRRHKQSWYAHRGVTVFKRKYQQQQFIFLCTQMELALSKYSCCYSKQRMMVELLQTSYDVHNISKQTERLGMYHKYSVKSASRN